ncbi:hypothetical protein A3Q56_02234 [Intoshia linei]|uniref:Fork-head domain-containing protein n=1 Tax=Intoshia linei TaxID=1819745 RepID=A0A177B8H8_9BILA|nr:hypothetical protein A3Q56_02234 [Intoshia linei]
MPNSPIDTDANTNANTDDSLDQEVNIKFLQNLVENKNIIRPIFRLKTKSFDERPSTYVIPRPRLTYAQMIWLAIYQSEVTALQLSSIYNWIINNFEFFDNDEKYKMKNSVRHNLCTNDSFFKVKPTGKKYTGTHFWYITESECAVPNEYLRKLNMHHFIKEGNLRLNEKMMIKYHLKANNRKRKRAVSRIVRNADGSNENPDDNDYNIFYDYSVIRYLPDEHANSLIHSIPDIDSHVIKNKTKITLTNNNYNKQVCVVEPTEVTQYNNLVNRTDIYTTENYTLNGFHGVHDNYSPIHKFEGLMNETEYCVIDNTSPIIAVNTIPDYVIPVYNVDPMFSGANVQSYHEWDQNDQKNQNQKNSENYENYEYGSFKNK